MSRFHLLRFALGAVVLGAVALGAWVVARWLVPQTVDNHKPEDAGVRFVEVTEQAGIRFKHFNGATGRKLLPETMGSGVAVLDFDRDGKPDLFFVNSRAWPGDANPDRGRPTQALYRNRGDGTFEDVTAARGLDVELYGMGVAVGDFDNDGWPDLFISACGGNRLYRNASGKTFEDVTERVGLPRPKWPSETAAEFAKHSEPITFPSSAAWLDYDGDGKLDLFVCNYLTWSPAHDLGVAAVLPGGVRAYVPPQQFTGAQCELWRNTGTKFEDVSEKAGIHVTELIGALPRAIPVGKALGVVVCDPDRDGWPDIIVANDTARNFFFHNQPGSNGARLFKETGLFSGIAYADGRPRGGMGIDAGEVHPDTHAVVVANFTNEPNSLFQLRGTNPIRFGDIATETGLAGPSRQAMKFGALFLDCDRDGRLDLFTANGHLEPDIRAAVPNQTYQQPGQLFRNTGKLESLFTPVGGEMFPPMVGRGCAYLDYNGDGKLDLVVTDNNGRARLFKNDTPDGNNFIRLVLTGAKETNRDALGAEVTVHAGELVQRRYVTGSHGYLSQSELALIFGLGNAERIDRVSVRWPGRNGKSQEWRNLPAGATYRLTEGEVEAKREK